jgi:signal transduction histidine kinase/CheY-like chemotaxis protein
MLFRERLKTALNSSASDLVRLDDFEHSVQRRLFLSMAAVTIAVATMFSIVDAANHRTTLAWLGVIGATGSVLVLAWAVRTGRYAWPLRLFCGFMFALLGWATLQQGKNMPAAGWWLSVIPLILASGGLFYTAMGSVLAFICIVTLLHFGDPGVLVTATPEASIEPWRRFTAIVGSELLALTLIVLSMRWRMMMALALDAARAAARDANDVKARFLANMSHEIRTPLNGIIGAAELLDSPRLSNDQRMQLLALQRQSAKTLLALVNDVLDVTKLDAGKLTLEAQPVFLRGVVFEANELFSVQAYGKGIELSSSCNPDVPQTFLGDPIRLRQIVNNLVSNAVKFTSRGGVHIHLSIDGVDPRDAAVPEGTKLVRIEVVDSGPGIAKDQQERLFDAFTQADNSVSRRFGGTGLGLNIVRELARLMGGRIELRSTVGSGSNFALVVPLTVESNAPVWQQPSRRHDVVLVTANRGLERHLKSLLYELNVDPVSTASLPTGEALAACRLMLVDAPLLQLGNVREWLAEHAQAGRRVAVLTPLGADAVVGLPDDALLLYKPVRRKALEAVLGTIAPNTIAQDSAADTEPRSPVSGMHVLVAEDNPVNQVVVQAMLAELGATCVIAGNGREALVCAMAEPFDLVLMDMHMPEMDGLEATRELRKAERLATKQRVPVIAMTANSESDDGAACLGAGMDGFLSKPFTLTQLRRCLARSALARGATVKS